MRNRKDGEGILACTIQVDLAY